MLVLAMPQAAGAQQAGSSQTNPADMKVIADCLKSADKNGNLGTGCIGLVADPCTRKAESDVAKSKACAQRELLVWNALTEAAAKRVRAPAASKRSARRWPIPRRHGRNSATRYARSSIKSSPASCRAMPPIAGCRPRRTGRCCFASSATRSTNTSA
jgi:hypothetical protein